MKELINNKNLTKGKYIILITFKLVLINDLSLYINLSEQY